MTYQEKVDFLETYQEYTLKLYGLTREAQMWREIAAGTSSNNDGMPGSHAVSKKVQDATVRAADLVNIINKEIETAKAKREAVRELIKTVPNTRYRLLMEMHYINGLSVADISRKNDKGEKWIREMLKKAVNSIK
jgi:DNA-directed RNA polymerase specialized sigma24 family protein